MEKTDIYAWIKEQENSFETEEIAVGTNWNWNFRTHIQMIFHLKNGVFFTGLNDWMRAFKNIMEPILEISYWTEDIEVKDVVFFIEESANRALSFLIKKYHDEVYVREHDIDTMIDEMSESDIDYGGTLMQKGKDRPEVISLNSVAFCDQTDMLGGPVAFKYYFSPSKLREMSKLGWGKESNGADISLEDLCTLATADKDAGMIGGNKNKVPGKAIEVYIIKGSLPEDYLYDDGDHEYQCDQVQIRAFYSKKDGKYTGKEGVCLYKKKGSDDLDFSTSQEIYGRALGRGIGERIMGPQIWTNFLTIHKTNMLAAGSKVPLVTDDPTYTQKNKIQDMETLEITTIEDGKVIRQVPTIAVANVQLFEKGINEWFEQGQFAGSAFDSVFGKEESAGTTFRGQNQLVQQGRGPHDRRRGKRAKAVEKVYRKWIIPDMVKEITKGKEFMATLSTDELSWVADQLATNAVNERIKDLILDNKMVTPEQQDTYTTLFKQDFFKKGNKHLFKILKDDLKGIEDKIGVNIVGKQKNVAQLSDKLLSIFQSAFQNPQGFVATMQIPGMAKSFSDILEFSGISPVDFAELSGVQLPPQQAQPSPVKTNQPMNQPTMA